MYVNPKNKSVQEVIFVGLPGLTHHYGGLSPDNIASDQNRGRESSPRQAALQVIAMVRYLLSLGIVVGILPPQLRTYLPALDEAGFTLDNAPLEILEKASSSSFMWAANAATVTPVMDSNDGNLHITIANLHTNQHRRIEAQATYNIIKQIFAGVPDTVIHAPLQFEQGFLDEGAANHMRLSPCHDMAGLNVFVYGKRQNLAASQELAKKHNIPQDRILFLEQNPGVINKGVFHNDVIAVGNENLLLLHARAYKNGMADIDRISEAYTKLYPGNNLQLVVVSDDELTVEEAVGCYLFNSQIVTRPDGKMAILAPTELKTLYNGKAAKLMEKICAVGDTAIDEISYIDLRESMQNGGGPACLRLRVPMTYGQVSALNNNTRVLFNEKMLIILEGLIEKYYPQSLIPQGLRNPELYKNGQEFLNDLSKLLHIAI